MKKKKQFVYNCHKYQFDSRPRANGSRIFNCIEFKQLKCPNSMTLINDEIQSINCEHNHLPMFEDEVEYLTSVHQLKQVCSSISLQEVKRRYEQIHQHLDQKYGRKILTPYWRSWSSIRTTFNKIQSTNKCEIIAKNASNIQSAPQLTVISNNQSFLREYNVDNSPFMIFMSDEAK